MPSSWRVTLGRPNPRLGLPGPASVHSLVSTWLDQRPEIPRGADHWGQQPYSVGRPIGHPGRFTLRIGLIDDDLVNILWERARPGVAQRFQQRDREDEGRLVPDDALLTIVGVERERQLTVDALRTPWAGCRWRVTHESPATQERWHGSYECLHGAEDLLARPAALLRTLLRQDTAPDLTPRTFGDKMLLTGQELSSTWDPGSGATKSAAESGGSAPRPRPGIAGTLGWTEWYVRDTKFAPLVDAALHLAEFSGVGNRTSEGYGAVSVRRLNTKRS